MNFEFINEGDGAPERGGPDEGFGDDRETELRIGETTQDGPEGPVDRPITSGMMQPIEPTEKTTESTEDDRPPEGATTKEVADFYGIPVDSQRDSYLNLLRRNAISSADETEEFYLEHKNGLAVTLREADTVAPIDFMPGGRQDPPTDSLTRLKTVIDFIDAAQDVMLLFESDRLPKPSSFVAITNSTMADFLVRRFGFTSTALPSDSPKESDSEYFEVYAEYNDFRRHVTSRATQEARDSIANRIKSYDT